MGSRCHSRGEAPLKARLGLCRIHSSLLIHDEFGFPWRHPSHQRFHDVYQTVDGCGWVLLLRKRDSGCVEYTAHRLYMTSLAFCRGIYRIKGFTVYLYLSSTEIYWNCNDLCAQFCARLDTESISSTSLCYNWRVKSCRFTGLVWLMESYVSENFVYIQQCNANLRILH